MVQLIKETVEFPNHNRVIMLKPSGSISAREIVDALDIKPAPKGIVLIFGGAEDSLDTSMKSRLIDIVNNVVQFATEAGLIIVDGGTKSGIMEIIGERVAAFKQRPILLGVAPAGRVTYPGMPNNESASDPVQLEPNHSHFILVEGNQWGDETETLFEVVNAFDENIHVAALLAGGGEISKKETFLCTINKWPIIVIERSGFLADQIASYKYQESRNITDSIMKEIILYENIRSFPFDTKSAAIKQDVGEAINYDPLLELAWRNFVLYDDHAKRLQKSFNRLQILILTLGVVASALALSQTQLTQITSNLTQVGIYPPFYFILSDLLHYSLIVLPIGISVLFALSNRFRSGAKWVLLRAGAEAIKSEIYHYRTRSHLYREKTEEGAQSPREKFSSRLNSINNQLMKTDVSLHGFEDYDYAGPIPPKMYGAGGNDDGYSTLSADQYIKIRIGDQLKYYRGRVSKLNSQLRALHWLILGIGGVGTFLAAVGQQLWIALTTVLAGVFLTFLEYRQVENTIIKYNQTITELLDIYSWWISLTPRQKNEKQYIDTLVQKTEDVLHTELSGWIKQMEDAIQKLSTKTKEHEENNKKNNIN